MTLPTPQLKIAIEERIKTHERAVDAVPWLSQKQQLEAKIRAFKEVLGMIEGPTNIDDNTPDCDCDKHKTWHWCPFHNWCNPVSRVGV